MKIEQIATVLAKKIEDVRLAEPMKAHTSFKVGGPADVLAIPTSEAEIFHAVETMAALGLPLFVMGKGSNLLVTSLGLRGVILKLGDNYAGMEFDGQYVTAKSGTSLSALVLEAANRNLGGAEFLGGIPGSLGGAIYMNAGAYGGEIKDYVKEVYFASHAGKLTMRGDEMGFGYRKSILSETPLVVVGAKLKLDVCSKADSICKLNELNGKRRDKQPLEYPSAGSTFKRPDGHFAGSLIEQAGLRGFTVGGAQVSEKHAGFVINTGEATSEDIMALIAHVQKTVQAQFGVKLQTEVKVVGQR